MCSMPDVYYVYYALCGAYLWVTFRVTVLIDFFIKRLGCNYMAAVPYMG